MVRPRWARPADSTQLGFLLYVKKSVLCVLPSILSHLASVFQQLLVGIRCVSIHHHHISPPELLAVPEIYAAVNKNFGLDL